MNPKCKLATATDEFWSFSLAFYDRLEVAAALLALQDEAGCRVNLILFAIWLGLSGRGRLDRPGMDEAERAIRSIEVEVIEPLRALRRRLKPAGDPDIQNLRESIKAIEIEAEEAAQTRLAALAASRCMAERSDRLTDAEANLDRYLGAATAAGPQAAIIRCELRRVAAKQ
jgi:uncharacterized protein (TIGR02444 family)